MTEWFAVEAKSPLFDGLEHVHVVFHGINKSGSKSMAAVLRRALFNESRAKHALSHYHMKGGLTLEQFREAIESRNGRFLAVGHYLYGYLRPTPRRIWVTQFRHPLPRTISTYNWLKNKHIAAHGTADGFHSLTEYVRKSRGIINSQVMQLGRGYGRFAESPAKLSLSAEVLFEMSVEALERDFTAIAIAEHFEESIFTFAGLLGLKSVDSWLKDDRNTGRPPVDELTQAERDLIRGVYYWDFELYDWALRKFREQCSRIEFGPSLARYKEACADQYKDRLIGSSADEAVANRFSRASAA